MKKKTVLMRVPWKEVVGDEGRCLWTRKTDADWGPPRFFLHFLLFVYHELYSLELSRRRLKKISRTFERYASRSGSEYPCFN